MYFELILCTNYIPKNIENFKNRINNLSNINRCFFVNFYSIFNLELNTHIANFQK